MGDVVSDSVLFHDEDLPEDLMCEIQEYGLPACWTESSEPESGTWVEPYAGYVPPVHPDTEAPSWDQEVFVVGSVPPDRPRRTPPVWAWVDWCGGGQGCESLEMEMVWALDYLGAEESCVMHVYYARVLAIQDRGRNWSSAPLAERLGWHRCPTIIDPRQPTETDSEMARLYPDIEVLLLAPNDTPMADRCREVLPADAELEWAVGNWISQTHVGLDCGEWARLLEDDLAGTFPDCFRSAALAREWLEHHHHMPPRFWRAYLLTLKETTHGRHAPHPKAPKAGDRDAWFRPTPATGPAGPEDTSEAPQRTPDRRFGNLARRMSSKLYSFGGVALVSQTQKGSAPRGAGLRV